MGLLNKIKKIPGISTAANVASRAVTAVESTPKAASVFGRTLASEGQKELNRPGSQAQRFASAPLGQFYLPKKVQSVGRALLPTPGGVVSGYREGVKQGGFRGGLRAGLTTFDVLSTPLVGSAAIRAPKAAAVAGRAAALKVGALSAAEGGLVRGGETGAVRAGAKATVRATQRKVAAEVGADIAASKPSEFTIARKAGAIHINNVPFSDLLAGKSTVPGLTKSVVKSEGFVNAFARVNSGKAASMTFRVEATGATPKPLTTAAIKEMGHTPNVAKAPEDVRRVAARSMGLSEEKAVAGTAPKAAPKPRFPTAEESAAAKITPKTTRPAPSPRRAGAVTTRKATPEELANFGQPAKSAVQVKPAASGGTTTPEVKPTAPKPKVYPRPAPQPKAPAATAVEGGQQTHREAVRELLKQGNTPRGAYTQLAKKYGISRQRISEIRQVEMRRMGAVPEASNSPASVAQRGVEAHIEKDIKPAMKARAAGTKTGQPPKPTINSTPAQPEVKAPKATKASTEGTKAKPVSPSQPEPTKVRVARAAADPTGAASTGSLASRIAKAAMRHVPKKALAVGAATAGGAVLLANRDQFTGGKGSTSAPKTEEQSFINSLPADLRENVKGLLAVKDKYGEKGLTALVQAKAAAEKSGDYLSPAEEKHPHTAARFQKETQALKGFSSGARRETLRKMAQKKQQEAIRERFYTAYDKLKSQ